MINIRFKIIAKKINKIPEFYTIFAQKMPDYIIRWDRGQAEAKCLRPRLKFWPRSHLSLVIICFHTSGASEETKT